MNAPKIKVEMNKGKVGVELEKLAAVARETRKFLISLSVDLNDPESEWIAENFQNGSLCFELRRQRDTQTDPEIWAQAFTAVMDNDFSNETLNLRIRPETRTQYFNIARFLPEGDRISFGVFKVGTADEIEWHGLDRKLAYSAGALTGEKTKNYGEIQGIVHSFFKETKNPKVVIRELSTMKLVDCFFNETMYEAAVELLHDKEGVVFVEGMISEDVNGTIADITVSDFTPARGFDEAEFERMIGCGPKTLTGNIDAQKALDDYRNDD